MAVESAVRLTLPGGGEPLVADGDDLVSQTGQRFRCEHGIYRMLGTIDEGLAAELEAQEAALDIYIDESYLLTRYEREFSHVALRELLGRVDGPILDAGCGVGIVGRLNPGMDLYGIDASFPLLRQIRSGYQLLVEGTVEALPFADGSFSAVLGLNVLHHVMDPARAIAEMTRVTRPGGLLVFLDPRKVGPIEAIKTALRKGDAAFAQTHKAFTVDEYAEFFREAPGLVVEEYRRFGLLALLAAGGLDQFRLSRYVPAPATFLSTLTRIDRDLQKLPVLEQAGLYFGVRARRVMAL